MNGLRRYAESTRTSAYAVVLVAPFVVIYEVGILALRLTCGDFHARNGADAIIRVIVFPLGLQRAGTVGAFLWSTVPVLVLLACYLVWRSREVEREPLSGRYAGWLGVESCFWAFALFVGSASFFSGKLAVAWASTSAVSQPGAAAGACHVSAASEIIFNAGAGVYEELVFRVLLVGILVLFCTRILHLERTPGRIAAVVAGATLFSLVHFGSHPGADAWGGETFWPLFFFRWAAGIYFSALLYFRGFGVAVASHALYDNMVTLAALAR